MKKLNRSLVATAILVATAAPAMAANYSVDRVGNLPVLAQEIFGVRVPAEANGQANNILVKAPVVRVDLDTAAADGSLTGDIFAGAETSTIQFTLNNGVTFGENLNTTQALAGANGGAGVLFGRTFGGAAGKLLPAVDAAGRAMTVAGYTYDGATFGATALAVAANSMVFEVIQGGSSTDNNITLRIRRITDAEVTALVGAANVAVASVAVNSFDFGNYQLNDLVDSLNQDSGDKYVYLSNEYTPAAAADLLAAKETTSRDKLLASAPLISVVATPQTDYSIAGGLRYISVASDQKKFTEAAYNNQFLAADDVRYVNLGELIIRRTRVCTVAGAGCDHVESEAGNQIIMGEDLNDYSFTADDVIVASLNNLVLPTNHPYKTNGSALGRIFLDQAGSDCSDTAANPNANITGEVAVVDQPNGKAVFTLTGNTTAAIELPTQVCFYANGVDRIPVQPANITASVVEEPINARYDFARASDGNYGPLVLDGCTASFFNVPLANNNSGDQAFLRLSNTSATGSKGGVKAKLYKMDGSVVTGTHTEADGLFSLGGEIAQHATAVYTSNAADSVDANGRTVAYSIPKAAGFDGAALDATGVDRLRLVAFGAFPYCEGLGLIRTANGSVVNMTATTQGNGDAQPDDTLLNRGNNTH